MRRRRSYGAAASTDARSQRRELAGGDHRSGRQAGGRTARWLQRYREHGVAFASAASSGGMASTTVWSARNRPTGRGLPSGGISQSSGTRVASALKAAGTTATVPRPGIDGGDEMTIAAALDGRDECLRGCERTEIETPQDTPRRARPRQSCAPPETRGSARARYELLARAERR